MVAHALASVGPDWLWHPLGQCAGTHAEVVRCRSYNFWSGIVGDVSELTLLAAFGAWFHHRNCVTKGCWRLGHSDPEHGHPVCKHHQGRLS